MDNKTQRASIEEPFLLELAGKIGKEWLDVGRHLAITEAQLQHLKEDNRNNQKEVIYQMLLLWKQKQGSEAIYGTLSDALQKANRKDLAEYKYGGTESSMKKMKKERINLFRHIHQLL